MLMRENLFLVIYFSLKYLLGAVHKVRHAIFN